MIVVLSFAALGAVLALPDEVTPWIVTVHTQVELDDALTANKATIYIESPAGVWLTLQDSGSSHVVARGSSHVEAWGSSHVEAWGSSHVVARGSSHVEAWESSHVEASAYVAVHLHSQRVTLSGGVVIDLTAVDQTDPVVWCDFHGVSVTAGTATLYKALDHDLNAGHSYRMTKYEGTVAAADWRDDNKCGGGLHLGPTTTHATTYYADASRWVAVTVAVADIRPILGGTPKCKVRLCTVVGEVDRYGKALAR